MTLPRATELEYEAGIISAAKAAGWLIHAERAAISKGKWSTAIKGNAGFPDIVATHPRWRRLLILELKRKPNRLTKEQQQWLDALTPHRSSHLYAGIAWVPEQYSQVLHQLANPHLPFSSDFLEDM